MRLGNTFIVTLKEMDAIIQIAKEQEREACAKVAESYEPRCDSCLRGVATAIRARGIDAAIVGEVGVWGEEPPKREWVGLTEDELEDLEFASVDREYGHLCKRAAEALRQALAQEEKPPVKSYCGGKPNYCTPEVTTEVTGDVGACVTCGAPKSEWLVDAVNISQERVDETAKREHEPYPEGDVVGPCICGSWPGGECLKCKRIEPPKREWVGLTDEEIYDYADKFLYQHGSNYGIKSFGKAIEAKLKEKNGG